MLHSDYEDGGFLSKKIAQSMPTAGANILERLWRTVSGEGPTVLSGF